MRFVSLQYKYTEKNNLATALQLNTHTIDNFITKIMLISKIPAPKELNKSLSGGVALKNFHKLLSLDSKYQ